MLQHLEAVLVQGQGLEIVALDYVLGGHAVRV